MSEIAAAGRPTLSAKSPSHSSASVQHGERLAVVSAAAAVAMMPLLIPRGPSNIAPVDLLIGLTLATAVLWASLNGRRWHFPYVAAMSLFVVGGCIGALRGPVPGTGAIALIQDVTLLFWCWALANVASSPGRLRTLLHTWAYSAIGWTLLLFIGLLTGTSALTGQTAREGVRTSLTMSDPNISANYYFISMMVIWAAQCPRRRSWRLAAYALLLAATLTTGSNSAIVSVGLGLGVAGILGLYRREGMVPAVTATALAVIAIFLVNANLSMSSVVHRAAESKYAFIRDGIGRGQQSAEYRVGILSESRGLYEGSGTLGAGPVSTKVRFERLQAPVVKEAHDDYLAALVERGAIGFIGLLLLIATVVARATTIATRSSFHGFGEVVAKPNAIAGAVAGTLAAAFVYEVLHVRHVWALFALVAAVSIWGRE